MTDLLKDLQGKTFRCICADPPWRYKTTMAVTGNAPGRTRQHGRSGTDYPTMSIDEVASMPVRDMLHAEGAHVYLWTTNAHAEHAWRIMRAWGCEPKQLLTWAKKPKGMIGFGAFSPCTEFCLFGSSAKRAIHEGRSERTWWEWPRTIKHSEKPQGFFDVIEAVSPGPRLELFARRQREGWTCWGNEVETTIVTTNSDAHRSPMAETTKDV